MAFPQIRTLALGLVIALSFAACGGTTVEPPSNTGSGNSPTSTPVTTSALIVVDSDTDGTEAPTSVTDGNAEGDAPDTDPATAQDTVTTTTGVVSNSEATTTTTAPETTIAPSSTIVPPTTFEVITVEPSSGPPPIETVEPNA